MKLWIDDLRTPPDSSWFWAKTSEQALFCIEQDAVLEVSFDHDLGGDDTSIKVANEIERLVYEGIMPLPVWHVHSANPVGRANLSRIMESATRFADTWNSRARAPNPDELESREREGGPDQQRDATDAGHRGPHPGWRGDTSVQLTPVTTDR